MINLVQWQIIIHIPPPAKTPAFSYPPSSCSPPSPPANPPPPPSVSSAPRLCRCWQTGIALIWSGFVRVKLTTNSSRSLMSVWFLILGFLRKKRLFWSSSILFRLKALHRVNLLNSSGDQRRFIRFISDCKIIPRDTAWQCSREFDWFPRKIFV